jgi:hypothetical protein
MVMRTGNETFSRRRRSRRLSTVFKRRRVSVVCVGGGGVEHVLSALSSLESEAVTLFRHYPDNPRCSS